MSECVVRMEMPDSCPCELAGGYDIPLPCFAGYGCPARCKEFDECVENGTKPDWCPFVCALPEGHGRLVDADALKQWFIEQIDCYKRFDGPNCSMMVYAYEDVCQVINDAPTIVPATAERSET